MSSNDKIYVQIASYRDPELRSTLESCIEKADRPENLVFSIVWQRSKDDEWDKLDEYLNDPRFHIIQINHAESKGACWARNLSQKNYSDEQYLLQIDSHHRFVQGWDTICKQMILDLQNKGYEKPLLTTYLTPYDPKEHSAKLKSYVSVMRFDRFTQEGIAFFIPEVLKNAESRDLPVPCRFFSGHFVFTLGQWNKEVPYDPNLYFHGEEITLAVRSFTHGYDIFSPNRLVAYHEYTRQNRNKHWDDHDTWVKQNADSIRRVKGLLGVDGMILVENIGAYGLGKLRTIEEYERYAGLRFRDRAVHQNTVDGKDPMLSLCMSEEQWNAGLTYNFRHCLDVWKNQINDEELLKYDGLAIIYENEEGKEVFRQDASRKEILEIIKNAENMNYYQIWRTMPNAAKLPRKWVVWPYNSVFWGTKIEGSFNYCR